MTIHLCALCVPVPEGMEWPDDNPVWYGLLADRGDLLAGTRLAPPPPPQEWRPPPVTPRRPLLQITAGGAE